MSSQQPLSFYFWWPTSVAGGKVMRWWLGVVGIFGFIKGCIDDGLVYEIKYREPSGVIASILFFYVALNIAGWYFIINICRFVNHRINQSVMVQTMRETRHEKAELESLRRRREIKQLKDELGTDPEKNGSR
jgi:hypothetical protein